MLADSLPLLFDAGCRCLAGVLQAPSTGCYRRNIGECDGANGERRGVVGDEAWAKEVHMRALLRRQTNPMCQPLRTSGVCYEDIAGVRP